VKKILLASPLFILRRECEKDLFGVLSDLQALGFDGVEMLGFFGRKPEEIARHLRGENFIAMGNHVPYAEFEADFQKVAGDHEALGVKYITVSLDRAHLPCGENYPETVDKLNEWAHALNSRGISLLFHNHAGEFYPANDDQNALEKLLSDVEPMKLEPDLGWMGIAGEEPAKYLKRYADRSPVLHFKDFYAIPGMPVGEEGVANPGLSRFAFRPTGYGVMRYPVLIGPALDCKPEWIVADHDDAYDNDIYHELFLSMNYIQELLAMVSKH